ncbi:MAG: hypothetical protein WKG32_14145 [Gemmatimonadaceae bacterium]
MTSRGGRADVERALDEARFGPARTLNLRASLPTAREAVTRAESWVRRLQAERAGELLIITGRGNASEGGVSPVRAAVLTLLSKLQRGGVVNGVRPHTPGSFVVELAPFKPVHAARQRRLAKAAPPPADPAALAALDPESRAILREVAERALSDLGVHEPALFLHEEMLRQFSRVAARLDEGPDREARLRSALRQALEDFDT